MSQVGAPPTVYGAKGRYELDEAPPRDDGPVRTWSADGPDGPVHLRMANGDESWLLEETAVLRALQPRGCAMEVLDFGKWDRRVFVVHPAWSLSLAGWLGQAHSPRERARAAELAIRAVMAVRAETIDAPLVLHPGAFAARGQRDRVEVRLLDLGVVAARTGHPAPAAEGYTAPEARLGRGSTATTDAWALGLLSFRALVGSLPAAVVSRPHHATAARYEALAARRPLPELEAAELDALDAAPLHTFYSFDAALTEADEDALRAAGANTSLVLLLRAALDPDPDRRAVRLAPLADALAALDLPTPPPPAPIERPRLPRPPALPTGALIWLVLAAGIALAWWGGR